MSKRFYGPSGTCYHCISRAVHGRFLIQDEAKSVFRKMLWQVADFCGLEIITYCVMTNHFHILVRIKEPDFVSDSELVRRWRVLYPEGAPHLTHDADELARVLAAGGPVAEKLRESILQRMHDLSEFMRALKQRFTIWYNRSYKTFGAFWAERFKSVIIEGKGFPLQTVAAYIDLNAVRAGIVERPEDYPFCGLAEAVEGRKMAREGVSIVMAQFIPDPSLASRLKAYKESVYQQGGIRMDASSKRRKSAFADGSLNWNEGLEIQRLSPLSMGIMIGSRAFLEALMVRYMTSRKRRSKPKVHAATSDPGCPICSIKPLR